MMPDTSPEAVTKLFTRADGSYLFARWGRPIAPVAFGVEDSTVSILKGAIEAVCQLAGHEMAETDAELGSNFMVFFLREWQELVDTPNLDRLIPELGPLVERLKAADANQYRLFRFDPEGGIKACFVFVRMDAVMSDIPAETICLGQVVQSILLWSDEAFLGASPLALTGGDVAILKPDVAAVIRAAYDPVMPVAASDPSHAIRLAARIGLAS
ncbi:hypothetical protein [Litoreibacter arenae]|uniref:Uncharacterized protein n=1 Tax=Litoreibacter arenae DSM 19593 TaxID=1123360 RepID=S9S3L3_9RHOB|nr:hypothetical protein [Litoreibacter arenae]EPX80764.1 hypothetical protein thalar_00984 [Litoreibacter arenae DSM 19593]